MFFSPAADHQGSRIYSKANEHIQKGGSIMAKVKIEKDMRPHEVSSHWKKDLFALMSDFCIAPEVARHIITQTEKEAAAGEPCCQVYRRGWQKFRTVFLSM